ncbi:MAG: dihydroorotate dehydrogenase electron transfer subunit [Prolixibacteraceae bacterium]|jgi:dihydroorotate dehydrogenase electron transfer subunit|nr:dihydroorotate dehydrogenase electron transfer subunit [Prolixibacteraceae bacterium]
MNKKVCDLILTKKTQLNHDNYLLELQSKEPLSAINPGQFVNVLIKDASSTFLRRPFSVHEVIYATNSIVILVKTVGEGTYKLVEAELGDKIDVVFPLGNGFSLPKKDEKILLIGGGVGIAPMMQMGRESKEARAEVHFLLGARSAKDQILIDEFKQHGSVHLTTNDGSMGVEGFVIHHPIFSKKEGFDRIYCCGPDPMMHAVAKKAKALSIDCEVSLENMMACGFGVCLCCVTKTNEGNKCVCTDGPVFNIKDLEWQI